MRYEPEFKMGAFRNFSSLPVFEERGWQAFELRENCQDQYFSTRYRFNL
jgi:hypothetical protein